MAASLAKRLRAVLEHDDDERFDLGGFTEASVGDLVAQAFAEPLDAALQPLRFTFVVGGGKLVRQKYDADLAKWLTAALRAAGYEDDKGASLGAQGAFKWQHDTGANLMYVHVFPRLAKKGGGGGGGGGGGDGGGGEDDAPPTLDESDPRNRCLMCEVFDFKSLVASRVVPWAHRRRLAAFLGEAVKRIDAIEAKMVARQALSDGETALYAATSRANLEEKGAWLAGDMKAQVAAGALTAGERDTVLREMEDKLGALDKAAAGAAAGGGKAAAAATAQRDALAARRDAVKAAFASAPPATYPVRGLADIKRVRLELARLDKFEAAGAGKTFTAAEALARAKELDARPALAARGAALAADARGWFEADDEFEGRVREQLAAMGGGGARAAGGRR